MLNDSKYNHVSPTIKLNISHLFTLTKMIKKFYFQLFNFALVICLHSVKMSTVLFPSQIGSYQVIPLSSWWDTLRPAVVSAARIWSGVTHPWTNLYPQGAVFWGIRFIDWHLRGRPTGPKAFLGMLGASWLRPCNRTHLKNGLVPHSSRWWDGRQILLPLPTRMDSEVMVMKGIPYSTKLQYYWSLTMIVMCHILDIPWRSGFISLQKCRQCILHYQLTGLNVELNY